MYKLTGQDVNILSLIAQMPHMKWQARRLKKKLTDKRAVEIANCLLGNKGKYDKSVIETAKNLRQWAKSWKDYKKRPSSGDRYTFRDDTIIYEYKQPKMVWHLNWD